MSRRYERKSPLTKAELLEWRNERLLDLEYLDEEPHDELEDYLESSDSVYKK
jgi:hypothetical protein